MDTKGHMIASRRGFIGTFFGLLPGIVFANPKRLKAAKPEIRKLLSQMELETLLSSRPQKDPSVICHTSGVKTTLFRKIGEKREPLCAMNPIGYEIWEACDGRKSPKEISRMICKKYLVTKGQAWTDSLFFLARLKKMGAIL